MNFARNEVSRPPGRKRLRPERMRTIPVYGRTVLLAVERWYDYPEFGCHLGNVDYTQFGHPNVSFAAATGRRRRGAPTGALVAAMPGASPVESRSDGALWR